MYQESKLTTDRGRCADGAAGYLAHREAMRHRGALRLLRTLAHRDGALDLTPAFTARDTDPARDVEVPAARVARAAEPALR